MKSTILILVIGVISSLLATLLWHILPAIIGLIRTHPFQSFVVSALTIILILLVEQAVCKWV